jgi:hypothetical protein
MRSNHATVDAKLTVAVAFRHTRFPPPAVVGMALMHLVPEADSIVVS